MGLVWIFFFFVHFLYEWSLISFSIRPKFFMFRSKMWDFWGVENCGLYWQTSLTHCRFLGVHICGLCVSHLSVSSDVFINTNIIFWDGTWLCWLTLKWCLNKCSTLTTDFVFLVIMNSAGAVQHVLMIHCSWTGVISSFWCYPSNYSMPSVAKQIQIQNMPAGSMRLCICNIIEYMFLTWSFVNSEKTFIASTEEQCILS